MVQITLTMRSRYITSCQTVVSPFVIRVGGKIMGDSAWQANYQKFDEYTVSLAHPDAMVALMNNTGGVNAHFATSPFYEAEMKLPGARVLTTSYDILGGRAGRDRP